MQEAKRIASQALNFAVVDNMLYSIDLRGGGCKRAAVPSVLQTSIVEMYQGGRMAGHFSGPRLYVTLSRRWWWHTMYKDVMAFSRNCGECATVIGVGR